MMFDSTLMKKKQYEDMRVSVYTRSRAAATTIRRYFESQYQIMSNG